MSEPILGVIGGSGFYQMSGLEEVERVELANTPFGPSSEAYQKGRLNGLQVVFLSRHGQGHRLLPSEINFRANIYGMKLLGVDHLLSISAAGSMREDLAPGDFLIPDQFIDRTFRRPDTFFGGGVVAHVSMADPVCPALAARLAQAGAAANAHITLGGTYLCVEGPQFSTRAESELYRSWRVDVISMTALQEARLAREAELCYAALALVTDFDCWHRTEKKVDVRDIVRVLGENVATAQQTVSCLAETLRGHVRTCECPVALRDAIITDRKMIPQNLRTALGPILGKYLD